MGLLDALSGLFHKPEPTPAVPAGPFTAADLMAAGCSPSYLDVLNATAREFDIVTAQRTSIFLAQIAWESAHFTKFKEVGAIDGSTWQGFGVIQLTGEYNQMECAKHFGISQDRASIQAWLQTTEGAFRSAGWFWAWKHCNEKADVSDFVGVTRAINGGTNGLSGRLAIYQAILKSRASS